MKGLLNNQPNKQKELIFSLDPRKVSLGAGNLSNGKSQFSNWDM